MRPFHIAVGSVLPGIARTRKDVIHPAVQFFTGARRCLVGILHQEKSQRLRRDVLRVSDPPHMPDIVEIPVPDDISRTFLRISEELLRLSVRLTELRHVHEQVAEDRLTESMPHLIEFLIANIDPLIAVGPVPEDLVTLICFPFLQTQFPIGAVAFLR